MPNPFVHVELLATDMDRARTFYGEVFDWKFGRVVRGDNPYVMFDVGEGVGGNLIESPIAGSNPFWLPYVQTEDLGATLHAVRSGGGAVVRDAEELPGMGAFAIIRDPMGAALGLSQPAKD